MQNELNDIAIRLQGIIDTAIDGIITISQKGIVETVNNSAAIQFGYSKEEIIGNNIKMLMPEPYHSEHDGYLRKYEKTRKAKIIGIGREVIGKRKNGVEFPFKLAVSEVILNDRVIYTGIIHDLTEVKNAQKELIQLNEELEHKIEKRTIELEDTVNQLLQRENELNEALSKEKELNELKSRFVSMASHEFRTPLSTIMSSASLISKYIDEAQNDKREKHVKRIKLAVANLTGILNDFLSLSKIEEGKEEIIKENLNIQELVELTIDEVKGLVKHNQTIDFQHKLQNLEIYSDKRILKNVLFNLLSNAIKYSKPEGEIVCSIEEGDAETIIKVIDNGIGIPQNELKHLFSRFFRASNVESIQGTGLGLNIVKRYVELLSGEIFVNSTENVGTTFTVKLNK